jgi:aminoglycoside 6'-N-acetyltransferase I
VRVRRELHRLNNLTIRPLAPADHPGWSAMRQQLWPEEGRDDVGELTRMRVRWAVLVAERDGALVGFAEATIRSVVDGFYFQPAAFLEGIWVAPGARRQGVASALLAVVLDWAREQGVNGIGSDAHADNAESIAWHRHAGFAVESEVIKFARTLGPDRSG